MQSYEETLKYTRNLGRLTLFNLKIKELQRRAMIDFTAVDEFADDGGWYTLSGIKLNGKPQEQGVYIHNGKTVFVK